jgi:hypothetical protein
MVDPIYVQKWITVWCGMLSPIAMLAQSAFTTGPVCQTVLAGGLTSYYSVESAARPQPGSFGCSGIPALIGTSCQQPAKALLVAMA